MTALYSRPEKNGKHLLRRTHVEGMAVARWEGFDLFLGAWRPYEKNFLVCLLEGERIAGKLCPVAATFLGGKFQRCEL